MGRKNYTFEEDSVIRKYAKTKSAEEIGLMINRTRGSVQTRAGVIGVSLTKHGQYNHKAKHSDDDVRLVRLLLDDGELSHQEIAEIMEFSLSNVRLIHYGHTRNSDGV